MRLTTKGRYAATAMMDLAIHAGEGSISLHDIAEHQGISLPYLEKLFAKLRKRGLVTATRGPGGGYRLAKSTEEISIADVIAAVGEKVDITRCHGEENCQDGNRCLTHTLWALLSEQLSECLGSISLADAIDWPEVQATVARQSIEQIEELPVVTL